MVRTLTEDEKNQKRAKLIELATCILEREGEAGLTARGLAKEAGISRTTPYLYFKDKEAILNGIRIETLKNLTAQFSKVAPAKSIIQMRNFGEIYTLFGMNNPALYKLVFMSEFSCNPKPVELENALADFQSLMISPMKKAYEDGLISLPPERLNLVMWSCIHGLITLSHTGLIDKEVVLPQLRQDIGFILSQGFLVGDKNP
ncbi:MAG: TetR/AcrR family transcriptional regulator [Hyphomicrobiales bacterium]